MSFYPTAQLVIKLILWFALWSFLIFLSAPLMAEQLSGMRLSKSINYSQATVPDEQEKNSRLKAVNADVMAVLETDGYRLESTLKNLRISATSYVQSDISIYDVSTELISDFNYDGFYHRFSVFIDADTLYDTAYIFARLYLSYEGGPWNLYATSDDYLIAGSSNVDGFIIETELAEGFPAGYYDVRIELYDADYGNWLTSYGPYDDASLSALPLQSSYYDEDYVEVYPVEEVVVAGHAGSIGWWFLVMPVLLAAVRRVHRAES